eukprot:12694663-Ditylum_brightwellii.AAC.1
MAKQGEEVMENTPTETTEACIYKAEEDVQAEIEDLHDWWATLSTRCTMTVVPDVTPVKLFEMEFAKLDVILAGHKIVTLLCGGIFKDKTKDNQLIIPWSGTDLDRQINCFF